MSDPNKQDLASHLKIICCWESVHDHPSKEPLARPASPSTKPDKRLLIIAVNKDELLQMVRVGAEMVFSLKDITITDDDIDKIIAKGEEATTELDTKMKKFMKDAIKFKVDESFFVDINLFKANKHNAIEIARNHKSVVRTFKDDSEITAKEGLADDDANLVIKLKFLTYKYHDDKTRIKDAMKSGKITMLSTWTFEDFKSATSDDIGSRYIDINQGSFVLSGWYYWKRYMTFNALKFLYGELVERAKEKEEKEAKKRQCLADEFTKVLQTCKVREPMEAVYFVLIDVSMNAIQPVQSALQLAVQSTKSLVTFRWV
ncbi:hypothetical protein K2173_018628 [Erythroxylum novogranatense]|uniref:Uncharacterized protein n=1 Tax=Erythroxylum novogranatense TaxID=1862640 RepID=A0AAV8SAT8_9ROSI|nr:hypothetical protein K2173_018628 [Erythroxylum novogranatense]